MDFGFTVLARPTHVEAETLEQHDRSYPLVSMSRQGDDLAILAGRIRYRDELLDRIALPEREAIARCSGKLEAVDAVDAVDAALALGAYHTLGPKGLEDLEGDFSLVIWDGKSRRLVGSRDPLGGYPLFWMASDSLRAFSTSLERLLLFQPRRTLDLEYCAEYLMMPAQRNEGSSEACAYGGIRRVLPGTTVSLARSDEVPERRRYWFWHERIQDPGTRAVPEIAERYVTLLRTAVREHIRGTSLVHFSGGMDSTSIALLAGHLAQSGKLARPVHTISLEYERFPELKRETAYIEDALRRAKGVVAHRIGADELLDYDSFPDPPHLEEPYAGLWRLSMDRAAIDLAARIGASTVLSGIGADEIHHVLPHHLADSLRRGRVLATWSEATRWARACNCSPWTLLREYAAPPGTPLWRLLRGLRELLGRDRGSLRGEDDWTVPPWIAPRFARLYDLRERALAHVRRDGHGVGLSNAVSQALNILAARPGDVVRWAIAAPRGIAYGHPFFDSRLLAFGLGILTRLKPEPGLMKPVLAEVMRDFLPASIRTRRAKINFNSIYFTGLSRNLPYLESMIANAPDVAWDLFDRAILLKCLQEASLAGTGVRKLQRLNYTLGLIRWLCMQEETAGRPGSAATAKRIRVA